MGRLSALMMTRVKYLAVVVAGFALDMAVTLTLSSLTPLPLQACAVIGFAVALFANYFLFELWAFRRAEARVSGTRFLQTAVAAGIALSVRLLTITLLKMVLGDALWENAAMALAGAGVSLLVNGLLLSRIFASRRPGDQTEAG